MVNLVYELPQAFSLLGQVTQSSQVSKLRVCLFEKLRQLWVVRPQAFSVLGQVTQFSQVSKLRVGLLCVETVVA